MLCLMFDVSIMCKSFEYFDYVTEPVTHTPYGILSIQ